MENVSNRDNLRDDVLAPVEAPIRLIGAAKPAQNKSNTSLKKLNEIA